MAAWPLLGMEVSPVQVRTAAQNWRNRTTDTHWCLPLGRSVATSYAHSDAQGRTLFHVVKLSGGGFLVTSADTAIHPIIAFSASEDLVPDHRSPLYTLLVRDLAKRLESVRQPRTGLLGASGGMDRWASLLGPAPMGLSALDDVRVEPLVRTMWDQGNIYYNNDPTLYNYYTPGNYPCGCVATAMAQLMRFHEWPQSSITAATYPCYINGAPQDLTMQGGVYVWSNMPLVPKNIRGTITTAQRQAIGKLTSDTGISVRMQYASGGSGSSPALPALRFTDRFGYASAKVLVDQDSSRVLAATKGAALANIDAGFPVGIGIDSPDVGHFVVGDGYGFDDGKLYVHLNMGWSGQENAWYNLPDVDEGYYGFDTVDTYVYNVFPTNSGTIVSGRVVDAGGAPIPGASVAVTNLSKGGPLSPAVTTDAKGIYALLLTEPVSPATQNIGVIARYGLISATVTTNYAKNVSTTVFENGAFYLDTGSVGNRWGVDVELDSGAQPIVRLTGILPQTNATVSLFWELLGSGGPWDIAAFDIEGRPTLSSATQWQTLYSVSSAADSANFAPSSNRFFRVKAR